MGHFCLEFACTPLNVLLSLQSQLVDQRFQYKAVEIFVWLVYLFSVAAPHFNVVRVVSLMWEELHLSRGLLSLPFSLAKQHVSSSNPKHKEFH